MTNIVVSTTKAEVVVTEETGAVTAVTTASAAEVVTAVTEGPQGPQGPAGPVVPLGALSNVSTSLATDGSVLYYHSASSTFRADGVWTTGTLSDGGNF